MSFTLPPEPTFLKNTSIKIKSEFEKLGLATDAWKTLLWSGNDDPDALIKEIDFKLPIVASIVDYLYWVWRQQLQKIGITKDEFAKRFKRKEKEVYAWVNDETIIDEKSGASVIVSWSYLVKALIQELKSAPEKSK